MYERLQDLEERRRGRRALVRAIILLMQSGLDEDGAYSQLRRESMRARQSLELYCEELLNRRAKTSDISSQTTSVKLQDVNKRAM
jgi:AmiR/NasT family two-component response regulator